MIARTTTLASSAWSFPVAIASKKGTKPRFCVDCRMSSRKIKADRLWLQRVQNISNNLSGCVFFFIFGSLSGYWHMRVSEVFKNNTTFVFPFRTFQFEIIAVELMNAPSTLHRMIDELVADLFLARVNPDSIIIFLQSILEHTERTEQTSLLICALGPKIKISKCELAKETVPLLSDTVEKNEALVNPKKMDMIQTASRLTNETELWKLHESSRVPALAYPVVRNPFCPFVCSDFSYYEVPLDTQDAKHFQSP